MVYQGVPSRACKACRSRRVKCDETRPSCKRCVHAGRVCDGYPNELDILFRNETDIVKKRASKAERKEPAVSNKADTRTVTIRKVRSLPKSKAAVIMPRLPQNFSFWPVPLNPTPSTENEALAFFLTNYIPLHRPKSERKGYFAAMGDIWPNASISSPLYFAITATSLAAISKFPSRRHVRDHAAKVYGQALRKLAAAMNDPVQAKTNETLLTCLILAFYELIDGSETCIFGFAKHVDGAASLVRLRGRDQFDDPSARNIYRAVRSQTILISIQAAERMDEFPRESLHTDTPFEDRLVDNLSEIAMQIPSLRADANELLSGQCSDANITSAHELLNAVLELDSELNAWHESIPDDWKPQIIARFEPSYCDEEYETADIVDSEIYPGPVLQYKNMLHANVMNHYRAYRLFVQAIIGRVIIWKNAPPKNFKNDPLYVQAYLAICNLVNDVCASVPYHLGYQLGEKGEMNSTGGLNQAANAAGAIMLIWPLFVAGSVECIPKQQRKWIHGRMRYVATEFGLGQANVLRKVKPALLRGLKVFVGEKLQYVPDD